MTIKFSDHFTYKKLLRFTLPSIVMMIFTSIYGVVDGFFVSNFAGKSAFTAVNVIYPFTMVFGAIGFMFGTGGSALIAKTLGEGEREKANGLFSMLVYLTVVCGIVFGALGIIFIRPIAVLLKAEGEVLELGITYGRILLIALPVYMLQFEFQSFFPTAEKPQLGLWVTIAAGVTNIVLDALFIGVFKWSVAGAAAATALSQLVGGVVPVVYFFRKNNSLLRLGKMSFDLNSLWKTCSNGVSEFLSQITMSLVSILYNTQLMTYDPDNGVAAYGVLMYVNMIFLAVFIGYSMGVAPVVGYHYGAQNKEELRSIRKKSFVIIAVFSVAMFLAAELLAKPFALIFVSYDKVLLKLTLRAFAIFSFSFLFCGVGIFGSSFFTALNNGLASAIISFLRTVVFQVGAVFLLPLAFGTDGIWASVVVGELLAALVAVVLLILYRKKYEY